jgi:ATPase family associated with various cellular activities (AAA)
MPDPQREALRSITTLASTAAGEGGGAHTRAPGPTLLFSGPAGTGKTMAARIVGAELGSPVIEVDTTALRARDRAGLEVLLGRLFETARAENAVLFFEHADTILGDRPARGAHHARPGALAAPDLFERAERHPAPVIFASTLRGKIDASHRSHFSSVIEFPFPDEEARAAIWRQLLPEDASLMAGEIKDLASSFQLPGAAIATCCAAAVQAAERRGDPVRLADVAAAIEEEYRARLASDATVAAVAALVARASRAATKPTSGQLSKTNAGQGIKTNAGQGTKTNAGQRSTPAAGQGSKADASQGRKARASQRNSRGGSQRGRLASGQPRQRQEAPVSRPNGGSAARSSKPLVKAETNGSGATHAAEAGAAPATPRRERRLPQPEGRLSVGQRVGYALLAAGAVLAAAGIGYLAAQLTGGAQAARAAQVAAGPIRATLPPGWRRARRPAHGLGFTNELTLGPSGGRRAALTIGTLPRGDPNLLPPTLLSAAHSVPPPQITTIGTLSFYRYSNLVTLANGAAESVYATPTTHGTLVGVCTAPPSDVAAAGQCERILGSLRLVHGGILGARAGYAYARALDAVLSKLDAIRGTSGAQLAAAHTASAQALAASRLAAANLAAATAVRKLGAGPAAPVNSELAAALGASAADYGALANAARLHDAANYAIARTLVASADAATTAALTKLSSLGYRIG